MKLTWFSNAPWVGTGYGEQTALFVPRIKADGHDVTITANFGLAGRPVDWNGITVVGGGYDAYSNDLAPAHHVRWLDGEPGWMLTLFDAWVLRFPDLAHVASWMPVDHLTVPPEVLAWAKSHYSIAMSRFGQQALVEAGVEARYVPHAVDTAVFRPTPILGASGKSWRETVGLPDDAYVVGIIGANKGWPARKGFAEMFAAVSVLMSRHPDVHLYVHSDIAGFQGVDLNALSAAVGLDLARTHFVDQFANRAGLIPSSDLAGIYSGLDVFLATSYGEGFGIPVVEAQACGIPAIVTDATAQSELAGPGWKVGGQAWWNAPQRSWWVIPNIGQIVVALEESYAERGTSAADARSAAAVAFAADYDADRVYAEHMRPVLAEMESMLVADAKPKEPPNLALRPRKRRRAA